MKDEKAERPEKFLDSLEDYSSLRRELQIFYSHILIGMSSKSYDWAGDDVTRILPALNERSPEVIIKHNKFGIQKGDQFGPSNTPIETPYSNSNSNTNRYHKGSFLSQQVRNFNFDSDRF